MPEHRLASNRSHRLIGLARGQRGARQIRRSWRRTDLHFRKGFAAETLFSPIPRLGQADDTLPEHEVGDGNYLSERARLVPAERQAWEIFVSA